MTEPNCAKCGKTREEHDQRVGPKWMACVDGKNRFTPPANSNEGTLFAPSGARLTWDAMQADEQDTETKARKVAEEILAKYGLGTEDSSIQATPLRDDITAALLNFAKDCGGTKDL